MIQWIKNFFKFKNEIITDEDDFEFEFRSI